ncbi:hypothetical protein [Hippea sp. KM1]|uniref:hypothetical protein n=1 Tax=Hippea sp. KM1 TaxID=944481 RepID=UPI00046D5F64|nr:hypothetical protein [Hippea sp. KM1]
MFKIVVLFLFLFVSYAYSIDYSHCTSCHRIEKIDDVHNFSCTVCHLPKNTKMPLKSHKPIIKNPSSMEFVDAQCGSCHRADIDRLKHSLHYTLSSAINITRFVWHAQDTVNPIYGVFAQSGLKQIPKPKSIIKKPQDLVDDLLRRKCLRCHLQNNSYTTAGTHRAKGCAACHMEYSLSGRYQGSDRLLRGKFGFSKIHRFNAHPKDSNCLACHNNEFVGSDYFGMFPQDYHSSFRSPIMPNGYFKRRIFGIGQHHLLKDVHARAGLMCVDCHKKSDVMGDGRLYIRQLDAVKVSCSDCHGGYSKKPNPSYVRKTPLGYMMRLVNGRVVDVVQFNPNTQAHKYHKNLHCSACHAAWQSEHFQLNLYLDKTKNYSMWKDLIYQEDPYLERFLRRALRDGSLLPLMPDYISGKLEEGIWYSGWLARRWSYFVLLKDKNGKYYIGRPLFQYRLTYKDKNGKLVFDDVDNMSAIMPFVPHTISKCPKGCAQCHENPYMRYKDWQSGTAAAEFFKGETLFGYRPKPNWMDSKLYRRVMFERMRGFIKQTYKEELKGESN